MTMLATPANMRKVEEDGVKGVFSYSPVTNERYSATAADYFQIADDAPLKDETGEPMILATERREIIPCSESATVRLFESLELDTPEGVTYVPFVDGPRVGYEIRRDGRAPTYLYFNPSSESDDGQPNVFVYMGEDNDPSADDVPLHFYDIPHGLHGTVSPDGERTEERLS